MRKISVLLILCMCLAFFCSCETGSEAKLFTAQGDAALETGAYESALEFYQQAADTGDATNKVEALCEILSTYIEAKEAYDDAEYTKAAEILDDLDYDYNSYSPINADMRDLVEDVDAATKSLKRIDRALDELADSIGESDYDTAYELINELDGYDLDDVQSEELEYQISRLHRKQENTSNDEKPEKEPVTPPEQKPEKPVENNNESEPAEESAPTKWYRVRKSWDDPGSQLGAFASYDNAVKAVNENPGYKAYDESGSVVYP